MDDAPSATEPTQEEIREVLPDLTCATCNETRHVLDFYDEQHTVNLTVSGDASGEDHFGVVVDHGELALKRDRKNL